MRKIISRPFIPISIAFISGIIIGKNVEFPFFNLFFFLAIISILLLFSKRKSLFLLLIFIVSFGIFRFRITGLYPINHITHFIDRLGQEKLEIQGRVSQEPIIKNDKTSCIVNISSLDGISVKGRIQVFIKNISRETSGITYGDSIMYRGSVFRADKNNNPFSFNYREFLENKHIYGISYAYSNDIQITSSSRNLYYYSIISPRDWLRKRIERYYSPRYAGFLKAILLGEKESLPSQIRKDFARSGLSHILAVSGLHTGVIALILLLILQIFIRNRNIVRIITILLLIYYMLLAHAVPSVQRAVIMISLLLLAKILQRKVDSVNILFGAAFIILLINPSQLFSVGFQLSFVSVFSILIVFQFFSRLLNPLREKCRFLFWIVSLVFLSFVIQLILAPLTIYYFHTLAFGGIIANVLAIPMISLVLPLSLLSILLPIPFLSICYAAANKLLLFIIFLLSDFVSSQRILLFDFLVLDAFQVVGLYGILIVLILIWKNNDSFFKILVKSSFALVGLILLIIIPSLISPRIFQMTVLDVGQGDAIVIRTPNRKTILIDTGDKTEEKNYGEQVIIPYFQSQGIKSIDLLVLTHPHADHTGGAMSVVENMNADEVLLPKCEYESLLWQNSLEYFSKKNIPIIYADTSLSFDEFEPVAIRLLHPAFDYTNANNINNYSVVLRCDYKELSLLLTGDAEQEVENLLLGDSDHSKLLDVDILKVGHHGSSTSSSPNFIEVVSPDYSVISVGENNRYNLPKEEIIHRLENYGSVFRTDQDGAVVFIYGGNTLKVQTIVSGKEIFDSDI